jgi:hypothetical protein
MDTLIDVARKRLHFEESSGEKGVAIARAVHVQDTKGLVGDLWTP